MSIVHGEITTINRNITICALNFEKLRSSRNFRLGSKSVKYGNMHKPDVIIEKKIIKYAICAYKFARGSVEGGMSIIYTAQRILCS